MNSPRRRTLGSEGATFSASRRAACGRAGLEASELRYSQVRLMIFGLVPRVCIFFQGEAGSEELSRHSSPSQLGRHGPMRDESCYVREFVRRRVPIRWLLNSREVD